MALSRDAAKLAGVVHAKAPPRMRSALLLAALLLVRAGARAQDSAKTASQVAEASGQAAGALQASGVPTASAVQVLPMAAAASGVAVLGGSVLGAASVVATNDASTAPRPAAAPAFDGRPLRVDRRVVVAQPAPQVPYQTAPAPRP